MYVTQYVLVDELLETLYQLRIYILYVYLIKYHICEDSTRVGKNAHTFTLNVSN